MERAIKEYLEEVQSDVSALVYSDGEGASFEDKFTEYCTEILESVGKSEGARILSYVYPNKNGGIDWKINGYCLKDHFVESNITKYETLDLYITYFNKDFYGNNVTQLEYNKGIGYIKKFINSALKRHIDYIDKSNTELIELIRIIGSQGKNLDRINVYYLLNGISKHEKENLEINGININIQNWDLTRLFEIKRSNKQHEPIELDLEKLMDEKTGLPCLEVPVSDETYSCFLAIVPGKLLADLYKEYSNELLESNVRAFLGQAGKYNKGIRDTIIKKPQMFLPYNNGITATAENVETKKIGETLYITKLNDFQIVNGGQTTASLYYTQKKYKDADLDHIYVQMKLTVIKDVEKKNIEVPFISRFANSQNKVTDLDLSSNNPFFVAVEGLSRKKYVINPENRNQSLLWFFERTNGQYRESLNKMGSKAKTFKEQNPLALKFVKSDIAKFINTWEQKPHVVSQGSQRNFIHYIKSLDESARKNKLPGENFYKKLIANAILIKTVDKLFGRKNVDAIGDTNIKALTVAYTLSYFHFLTSNRLDLWKIYDNQIVSTELQDALKKLLVFTYNHIISKAGSSLISEYAKKESSWKALKDIEYKDNLITLLNGEFVTAEDRDLRETENETVDQNHEDTVFNVSNIRKLGVKFWDGLRIKAGQNSNEDLDYSLIFDISKKLKENKNLTEREIKYGLRIVDLFDVTIDDYEQIKSLSKLEDSTLLEVKPIYDKLNQLVKADWDRIIDLADQTRIFDGLELGNIKSISKAILRKEKIKEQSIIKAYDSIKKLSKFGIKI
ncbi:MAG: AIPR family protein [Sphingobacterium sp.]